MWKHPANLFCKLLADTQYRPVDLPGKKSGKTIDKIGRLQKRNELIDRNNFYVLKNCLAVMQLKVISSFEGGDHKGFLSYVIACKNVNEGNMLTQDTLREKKLTRI